MAGTFFFAGDPAVATAVSAGLEKSGFVAVGTAAEAEYVLTYEGSASALEELYFGEDGLTAGAGESTLFIDLSPTVPYLAADLHRLASVYGCSFVAAPIVVRDVAASDALSRLSVIAGGAQGAYDAAAPLLRSIAASVFYVGTVEQAQAAKVVHTVQTAASIVGAVEAYAAWKLTAPDMPSDDIMDVLEGTGVIAPAHETLVQALLDQSLEGAYTVGIMMAELAAALSALETQEMILPQADAAYHLMELLALVGGARFNPAGLSLAFAEEEVCVAHGLDWSAVSDGQEGDGCGCGHDHDDPDHECTCGEHGHHHHHEH